MLICSIFSSSVYLFYSKLFFIRNILLEYLWNICPVPSKWKKKINQILFHLFVLFNAFLFIRNILLEYLWNICPWPKSSPIGQWSGAWGRRHFRLHQIAGERWRPSSLCGLHSRLWDAWYVFTFYFSCILQLQWHTKFTSDI